MSTEHVTLGLRFAIALVLITAAVPKLRNADDFRETLENYQLLPQQLVAATARWLPWIELVVGVALLIGLLVTMAAAVAAGAFVTFAVAVGVNLARGREIDCGCLSSSAPRRITWRLGVFDLALAAAAVALVIRPTQTWTAFDVGGSPGSDLASGEAFALLIAAACSLLVVRLSSEWFRLRSAAQALKEIQAR